MIEARIAMCHRTLQQIRTQVAAILLLSGMFFSNAVRSEDWRFLDGYATALIREGGGTDERALLSIRDKAAHDPSSMARAYVLLADALIARMQFNPVGADGLAIQCITTAKATSNVTAHALCGWLRLNLARARGDFRSMATIAESIDGTNETLLRKAGLSPKDIEANPKWLFLQPARAYEEVKGWEIPKVRTSVTSSEIIKLDVNDDGRSRVTVWVNKRPIQFLLDTGSGSTIIPTSLNRDLKLPTSKFREMKLDLRNQSSAYRVAQASSISLGPVEINNFPVSVGGLDDGEPILGMDFLSMIGRFSVSANHLILNSNAARECNAPARMTSSITPDLPLVAFKLDANARTFYASLDTGAHGIGFALGKWDAIGKFNLRGVSKLKSQSVKTISGDNSSYYVEGRVNFLVAGKSYRRDVRFYADFPLNTDIVLSMASTKDFSYDFDFLSGMACIRRASL